MADLRKILLLPFIISGLVSFASTPLAIKFARKFGLIDDPAKHKHPKVIHTYPIPRAGGIPIFIALTVACLIFLPLEKHVIGILVGALILLITGLLDDKYDLNPYLRIVLGFLAAAAPVAAGIGISFVSNPMGGTIDLRFPLISDIIGLVWIFFLMNTVNMGAKGVDGQLSGVAVISAFAIAFLSLRFSADITQWPVIILAAIIAGAYFGFLPWHIYPQKIMPGYGGSTLAGYLLGVASILSTTKVGVLMVVLGVPLIDTGYTIIRRIMNGKSPVWGDRGHLHHKLLDLGMNKAQVALFYWGVTAILGILAINLNTTSKIYTMVGVATVVGVLILWLTHRSHS